MRFWCFLICKLTSWSIWVVSTNIGTPKSSGLWVQALQVQIWILGVSFILTQTSQTHRPIIHHSYLIKTEAQSVLLELLRKHSLRRAAQITKASGSWSYSCFSKGSSESNTVIFQPPPQSSPGIWTLGLKWLCMAVWLYGHGVMVINPWLPLQIIDSKQFLRIGNHFYNENINDNINDNKIVFFFLWLYNSYSLIPIISYSFLT